MKNFKDKFSHFMSGRYGADQLYYALTGLCFTLMIANSFIHSDVINTVIWAALILMIFRTFSRNILKRQIENEKFLKIWNPVKQEFSLTGRRIKEIKTNRYRKCPHCKVVLRLPRKTGKHTVECPHCHKEFQVRVRL